VDVYGREAGAYDLSATTLKEEVIQYQCIYENVKIKKGQHDYYLELPHTPNGFYDLEVDFKPDTLNIFAHRKFVTCYVERLKQKHGALDRKYELWLPGRRDPITAEKKPRGINDYDGDGVTEIMLKFDGSAVHDYFKHSEQRGLISVVLVGIRDQAPLVAGFDQIRVLNIAR